MGAYGVDFDDCPNIFTRDGNNEGSSLIYYGHKVNFKLQDGLHTVHVRKSTEDDMNALPVLVLTSYMVYNPKELSGCYLVQYRTGAWYAENFKKCVDITVIDILESIL